MDVTLAEGLQPAVEQSRFVHQGANSGTYLSCCNQMAGGVNDGYFKNTKDAIRLIDLDSLALNKNGSRFLVQNPSPQTTHAVQVINQALNAGRPVLASIYRSGNCAVRNDGTNNYFVLLVSTVNGDGRPQYRFYDPGSWHGADPENILSLENGVLKGYNPEGQEYVVTAIAVS